MDRKGIIAIGIALLTFLWWSQHYSGEMQKLQQARQAEEAARKAAAAAAAPVPETGAVTSTPVAPAAPTPTAVPEQKETISTPGVEYAFTNLGGGVARAVLRQHQAEHGANVTLNEFGTTPIGALTETGGEGASLPWTGTAGPNEMTYERTDARHLQISKRFVLPASGGPEAYTAQLEVKFANTGGEPIPVGNYYVHTGSAAPVHQRDLPNYTGFGWKRATKFTFKDSNSFSTGGFLGMNRTDLPVLTEDQPEVGWAAVSNQYFTTILTPEKAGVGILAHRFPIPRELVASGAVNDKPVAPVDPAGPTLNGVEGALRLPGFTLAPGASETVKFQLYTGPREYRRLRDLGAGQDAILDFGMFRAICKLLLASMNWLHAHLGNSYGAAIVVLTLIIRGLMWPLQNKGTQSMKRMQALTPEMNALKEKYADDPQKMNAEVMKLYKTYGINPVAGCLPMVVQIPVFFGFYSMLGKAVELRNAHFLWWVNDLSTPDTVAHIFGFPLNVLPLLMMITMVGQMALSPKPNDPVQQKVAMFMPIIFIAFCYNYASALALYLTVQNVFSIAQLWLTRNQATPSLQKLANPGKKKR